MKSIFQLLLLFVSLSFFTNDAISRDKADEVLKKGIYLHKIELASRITTQHFIRTFPEKADSVNGFFTYKSGNELITLLYHKFDRVRLFARYRSSYNDPKATEPFPETKNLTLSDHETGLMTMREDAVKKIRINKDNVFTFYEGIPFNVIPVMYMNKKVVYVTSGSVTDNFLFMGNDYLLTYNRKNKFRGVERIHKSLIKLPLKRESLDKQANATIHKHLVNAIISETDIATLLMHKDLLEWDLHYVISRKKVSVFNLKTEALKVISIKQWRKMQNK